VKPLTKLRARGIKSLGEVAAKYVSEYRKLKLKHRTECRSLVKRWERGR